MSSSTSDEAYASFLDKANQDTGVSRTAPAATTSSASKPSTKAVDTEVPAPLLQVEGCYYTSEADEPFEPVSLRWEGGRGMPDEGEFGKLVGHQGEVSTISIKEFDPRGQYTQVVEAVEKVGGGKGGKTRVFKVELGRTRVEYYVVGFDEKGGRVVGMKAMAVES